MDYLKMILTGYLENQEYLTEYFIREQKKAEKEFINANEFFGKSNEVIQFFYEDIDNRLGERRNELYFMLGEAKNKTSNYRDTNSNSHLSYDEQCQQTVEYCESELKRLTRNDFTVHINKTYWIGNLWNKDIMFIEHFLKLAEKKLDKSDKEPQPESKRKKNTLWFKTGLLFAQGKMEKFYLNGSKNAEYTGKGIANEVGIPEGEKYILGTLQGYKSDKNLYNDRKKMLFIIDYCKKEGIELHSSFLDKLPPETF